MSSEFNKTIIIKSDYLYALNYSNGTESKLSIYDEFTWKWSTIIVRTDFADISNIEVEFPRLSICGRVEDIPKVRFDKKEGFFWAIINR
jgi:hypothetical protein